MKPIQSVGYNPSSFDLYKKLSVPPEKKIHLSNYDPDDTAGLKDNYAVKKMLESNIRHLVELQHLLYAEDQHSLLVILQGMDAAGKDGTIRNVFSGANPKSCQVASFKAPTQEELNHDFLWRIHQQVPPKGKIGIFDRSQYEDVLVVRVKNLIPNAVLDQRYDQINNFEKMLSENGTKIIKFFLYISKDKQKEKLLERLEDPEKKWKFNPTDIQERRHWDKYMKSYEALLSRCNTEWAPWFVIPANNRWFRNLAVSQIVLETLEGMNPKLPEPFFDDLFKIAVK